jgi:hypothetical protein
MQNHILSGNQPSNLYFLEYGLESGKLRAKSVGVTEIMGRGGGLRDRRRSSGMFPALGFHTARH